AGPTYVAPTAVWARLKSAQRVYYRAVTAHGPNGWENYQKSTEDDGANAPSIELSSSSGRFAPPPAGSGKGFPSPRGWVNQMNDVVLIPQTTKMDCWAAAIAMLLSYRRQASFTPESLAAEVRRNLRTSYGWDMLEEVKDHFGFVAVPLPSNASLYPSPEQWPCWLPLYGRLWVTSVGAPSRAVVVHGIRGDLTPDGTQVWIQNPWNVNQFFSPDDPIDFN